MSLDMYSSVVIGHGDELGDSAIVPVVSRSGGEHHIYNNAVAYLISKAYLDMGMTIFKNTYAGGQITRMLENDEHIETIKRYIAQQYITHVDPDVLMSAVNAAGKIIFEAGRKDKAAEIVRVLGISSQC